MDTGDKIVFVLKLFIVAVISVGVYQWYTGDMRVQNFVMAKLEKSGVKKSLDQAGRKTAAVYNKVIGDDLKKTGGDPINKVKEQLKAAQDLAKEKEKKLLDIENR